MTKRILAALTALTLSLSITACGNVPEDNSESSAPAKTDSSSAEQEEESSAEDSSEEEESKAESQPEESKPAESDTDSKPAPAGTSDLSFEIDPDYILFTYYDTNDTLTNDDAAKLAALALEQYQAGWDDDLQKFLDMMKLESLAEAIGGVAEQEMEGNLYSSENLPAKYNVLTSAMLMSLFLAGSDYMDNFEWHTDKEDYVKRLKEAMNSITAESVTAQEELNYTLDEIQDECEPWLGSDENTVVWIEVDGCDREGDNLYVTFDMGAIRGDHNYVLDEVIAWRVDGVWGIVIGDARTEENPYKGKTADEIMAMADEFERSQAQSGEIGIEY